MADPQPDANPPPAPAAVLDVARVALMEIAVIVGNANQLGPADCAAMRAVLRGALNQEHDRA